MKPSEKEIVSKKGTKRSFSRMSQKSIDKALDVKILDYLSDSGHKHQPAEGILADLNGDISFGQSVAAQLSKMDKRHNAFAKAKIQMVLFEVQFPREGHTLPGKWQFHVGGDDMYSIKSFETCFRSLVRQV